MRLLFLLLSLLSGTPSPPTPAVLPAAPAPANAVVGRWLTADKVGVIEIYAQPQPGSYAGKIVAPLAPPRLDANNPDPALRRRPLLGVVILQGFRYAEGSWKDGTVYDPNNGKTYACTMRLQSANVLEVRGYIGTPLFGRTETWTRQL